MHLVDKDFFYNNIFFKSHELIFYYFSDILDASIFILEIELELMMENSHWF